MAKSKTFSVNLAMALLIMYEVRTITGQSIADIFDGLRSGSPGDYLWGLVIETAERLEAGGAGMLVDVGVPPIVYKYAKKAIGTVRLFKIGPLVVNAI